MYMQVMGLITTNALGEQNTIANI